MKALINANLFDFDTYRENCYLLFDTNIVKSGPMNKFPGADDVSDCSGGIVMPGFVVGHTHIYSTFSRGWNTYFSPKDFRQMLKQLWWKLDAGLDREAVYESGLVSGVEYIKNGVTTVIDHHASGEINGTLDLLKKAICDKSGLRGIFCFETSDRFPLDQCIEENLKFSKNHEKNHAGLFGMHASMTLSEESMKTIAESIGNLPIHIHVAESADDARECEKLYGKSIVERLNSYGLLKDGSLLVHCNYLKEGDLDIIKKRSASVVVNPTSNMNNGVGLPNVPEFLKKGISCILGSDGLGYNFADDIQNLVFTMHQRSHSPMALPFSDLKKIIKNGYDYAGKILGCRLGSFQSGSEADFLYLPYNPPTPVFEHNIWEHFFYGMLDAFHPRDVWCAGRHLLNGFKTETDENYIYSHARKTAGRLWKKIG